MKPTTSACGRSGTVGVRLNGVWRSVPPGDSGRSLLDWLRAGGACSAKEGCGVGDCGACTVLVSSAGPGGGGVPVWRAVNSCLLPVGAVLGCEVLTVEGLGAGEEGGLHACQSELACRGGAQCGYCTPGLVMALAAMSSSECGRASGTEAALEGNLCRCTGYRPIREAATALAARAGEVALPRPGAVPPGVSEGEGFLRPRTLSELWESMERHPSARLIAGGTDVGVGLPGTPVSEGGWISLESVEELRRVGRSEDRWRLGAGVTLTDLALELGTEFPEIVAMLRWFGSVQIRNRATLGGNLATASPVGDWAPVLLTREAVVEVASVRGLRRVPIGRFFVDRRRSVLEPGEVVVAVELPRGDGFIRSFRKVSRRRGMDIATVSACFAIRLTDGGEVEDVRIGCGGVASTPVRALRTEAVLRGNRLEAGLVARAVATIRDEFGMRDDVRGSAWYRREVLGGLLERFLREPGAADESWDDGEVAEVVPEPEPSALAESARVHVTGRARFVSDLAGPALEGVVVLAGVAHGRLRAVEVSEALRVPGVRAVLTAADVPGTNDIGAVVRDEPLLASGEILHAGQPVALVVAETREVARRAAGLVRLGIEPLPALLDLEAAIEAGSFHGKPRELTKGDVESGLATSSHRLCGELKIGGQEHFYLETHAAWAECGDEGAVFVSGSTQHPAGVQAAVASVLGEPLNRVTVESPRMGGGFGGKETQGALPAALAALAARVTGCRVLVRFGRAEDGRMTGKRHPFLVRFEAGFEADGRVRALRAELFADGGWTMDLSRAVADRALLHVDNAYDLPSMQVRSTVVKTHRASNTAFRGFGGPQGVLVVEEVLARVAAVLGLPAEVVRERNLYRPGTGTGVTHYGQAVDDDRIVRIWERLMREVRFAERRQRVVEWNRRAGDRRRGLAITPVKFGISFTQTFLNQAGALVLIHRDGTMQVNHGGTEMGQGLAANLSRIASLELGVPVERVRVMPTRTDKVPNASATAASCSTDLNGAAVRSACAELATRLAPFRSGGRGFVEAVGAAYLAGVGLSAVGHYRTPGLSMDWAAGKGKPFHYFSVGAAVSEVEVDGVTGEVRVLQVDVLHDAGKPIDRAVAVGQIEGGFVQGMGWLLMEELVWSEAGELLTVLPDTYKIPAIGDAPRRMRVELLDDPARPETVLGNRAVGEPPLLLAISVREAVRDAVAAFPGSDPVGLAVPATAESVLRAIRGNEGNRR